MLAIALARAILPTKY